MIVKKYIVIEVEADLAMQSFTGATWAEASEGALTATSSSWYGFPARILSITDSLPEGWEMPDQMQWEPGRAQR